MIVPDAVIGSEATMNSSNTTSGGYLGSEMGQRDENGVPTGNLLDAYNVVSAAFGVEHLLSHPDYLTNAVTDGAASGSALSPSVVDLMTELMLFGSTVNGRPMYEAGLNSIQFSLFRLSPNLVRAKGYGYWLRDIATETRFCRASGYGAPATGNAIANGIYVRPCFAIYNPAV